MCMHEGKGKIGEEKAVAATKALGRKEERKQKQPPCKPETTLCPPKNTRSWRPATKELTAVGRQKEMG